MSETKETPSPQKEVQETPPPQKEVKETPPPQKEVKETPPPQKEVKETPPSREAGEETTSSKKAGEASTSSQKAGEETTSSQKAGEKAATSSKKAGEETISPQKAGEVMAPSPQKAGEETAASPQKAGEEATLSQKEADGSNEKQDPEKAKIAGILKKWTNYFSRWQDRYVSCEEGWIFYFRSEKEVGDHCRGAMNLAKAIIRPHKSKTRRVDVKVNKRTWRFRASSETESQKWTDVLNLSGIHFRSKTNQNYPNILKLFPGYVEEKSKDKEKLF